MAAREELLERIIDHVAAHGLSDASMRDLAAAVGTSHRMLHYHFGGRHELVAAIVEATEARQRSVLAALAVDADSPETVVTRQWALLSQPAMAPFVRLFFELLAHAMHGRPGTERFLATLTEPWLDAAAVAGEQLGMTPDRVEARLGVAVMRGLLIDAVATGDPGPATEAFERFVTMWSRQRQTAARTEPITEP
jgi:AcrR family transcriptional regulator